MNGALAVDQIAFTLGELPLAVGCSRRAAKAIVREIGRRVGGRSVVLREDLIEYLRRQPKGNAKTRRAEESGAPANEFQISSR